MTSANPPYPYFNGISYNSQYFTSSSGSGLTQTQANALYLRKTTADTATALETFSGGIASNSIQSTTTSTDIDIGSSQTTGELNLGTDATRTGRINIGNDANTGSISLESTSSITIGGNSVGKTIRLGHSNDANQGNVFINKLVLRGDQINHTVATADLYIGNTQTSGNLYLGSGYVSRTGTINIGTNSGAGQTSPVRISTGTTTGALTLGNTNNTTNINSTTLNIRNTASTASEINIANTAGTALLPTTGNVSIASGTGVASSYTTTVAIGAGSTSGQITIGNPSNATLINSASTNIGNEATINTIYIGNGNDTDNDIRIVDGTGTNTSSVKISSGTTTGTLTLGNSNNTVQVNGTLSIGTGKGITLSPATSYVLPTTRQLGNIFSGTGTTTTLASITQLKSILLNAGTYILNANVRFTAPGSAGEISIGTSSTTMNQSNYAFGTGINGLCLNVTSFVGITADTNYYLLARGASNGTVSNVSLNIIRIA